MTGKHGYLLGAVAAAGILAVAIAAWHWGVSGPNGPAHPQEAVPPPVPVGDDHQTVTFVILPPDRVKGHEGRVEEVALFCDLLAERLSALPGIAVVDRSQLDRILAERAIGAPGQPPMLSYDAMVRVRPSGTGANSAIAVEVVDLLLGNLAASGQWLWQPKGDEAVRKAADLCISARRSLANGSDSRLKVRVVHVPQPLRTERIESLGDNLALELSRLLEGSPGVRIVHHLEAMSAKEESLLLLMGLSRLAGGRLFVPQADLSLELRLVERDAVGKNFDQTPIDVTVSLNWAGKAADTVRVSGMPGGRQSLVGGLHAELAKRVKGLDLPARQPDDMAERRKQAILELQRTDQWNVAAYRARDLVHLNSRPKGLPQYKPDRLKELADMASAAAKLDPTYEEAAFLAAKFGFVHLMLIGDPADGSPALREALSYLRRFNDVPDHRAEIVMLVRGGLFWRDPTREKTPLFRVHSPDSWHKYGCGYWVAGTKAKRGPVELLRQIVDLTLAQEATACPHLDYTDMICITHLGMIDTGLEVGEARRWRDAANKLATDRLRRAVAGKKPRRLSKMIAGCDPYSVYMYCCNHLSLAMSWAEHEHGPQHAKSLLEAFMTAGPPAEIALPGSDGALDGWVSKLKDPDLKQRFAAWKRKERIPARPPVQALRVTWPKFPTHRMYDKTRPKAADPSRYLLNAKVDKEVLWDPVGFHGRRLYVLYGQKPAEGLARRDRLGWIESPGASAPGRQRDVTVRAAAALPMPAEKLKFSCWAISGGKVALGTAKHGIFVLDPDAGAWRRYGPSKGLPLASVASLHSVGEGVLLACGRAEKANQNREIKVEEEVLYTLDLNEGSVRLVRRLVASDDRSRRDADRQRLRKVCLAWPVGQEWLALGRYNVLRDVLGKRPRIERWRMARPLPWKRRHFSGWPDVTAGSAVATRDHLLVRMSEGLVLFDRNFKPVNQWRVNTGPVPADDWPAGYAVGPKGSPNIPGDVPIYWRLTLVGGGGDWAVLESRRLLLLNIPTLTWYGPVTYVRPRGYLSSRMPCELDGDLLAFSSRVYSIKQIVAAAKAASLVWTDKQFRQLQTDLLLSQPPRDAIKHLLAARRFDDVRRLLDKQLKASGDDGELLLLGAWLYERPNLNEPAKAEAYYRRMVGLKDAPARLRGMLSLCYFLHRHRRIGEAAKLVKTIRHEFYMGSAGDDLTRRDFEKLARQIQRQAKKQPASAPSKSR